MIVYTTCVSKKTREVTQVSAPINLVSGSLWKEGAFLMCAFECAGFGRSPDGQAECDLVHEVRKVVNQIESLGRNTPHQVPEEVAKRVDGPTHSDDEAHGLERVFDMLVHCTACSNCACFAAEDLLQDVSPTSESTNEAHPCANRAEQVCLTTVPKSKHEHCADHQAPEHATVNVRLDSREDQVELDHLQWNSDRPIDVAVENGTVVNDDPILTHIEVMHSRDQSHQRADVQRGLPMSTHSHRFHQEEHSRGHHRD